MSYNTELQSNNADLQAILDEVNALPEMPNTVEQTTPTISVDANGLITAEAVQTAGYVEAGTKSATHQLPTQPGETVAPGTEEQTIVEAGTFVTGDIKVAAVESGGGTSSPVESDVNFYDFDGTLLYAYTLEEAQALTELPPAPTPKKDFLTFQEWNWTLDGIRTQGQPIDVGAIYGTVDGCTYLHIDIPADEEVLRQITLKLYCPSGNTVGIDWGDGTVTQYQESGNFSAVHNYSTMGEYMIRLDLGSTGKLGWNNTTDELVHPGAELKAVYVGGNHLRTGSFIYARATEHYTLNNAIKTIPNYCFAQNFMLGAIMLPKNCNVGQYSFQYCRALRVVSLPEGMTSIGYYGFRTTCPKRITIPYGMSEANIGYEASCREVYIPEGVTSIAGETFSANRSLATVKLPSTINSIGKNAFATAYMLMFVEIPEVVTSIGSNAFLNANPLVIRFLPLTPPTVSNANAFSGIPTACVVEVPAASLEAYQNATNYSGIAAQMVGV